MYNNIRAKYDSDSLTVRIADMVESCRCEDDEVADCLADLEAAVTLGLQHRIYNAQIELETAYLLWLDTQGWLK